MTFGFAWAWGNRRKKVTFLFSFLRSTGSLRLNLSNHRYHPDSAFTFSLGKGGKRVQEELIILSGGKNLFFQLVEAHSNIHSYLTIDLVNWSKTGFFFLSLDIFPTICINFEPDSAWFYITKLFTLFTSRPGPVGMSCFCRKKNSVWTTSFADVLFSSIPRVFCLDCLLSFHRICGIFQGIIFPMGLILMVSARRLILHNIQTGFRTNKFLCTRHSMSGSARSGKLCWEL